MSSSLEKFILKLHNSEEVPALLHAIEVSAVYPTCHTLCQALGNSWTILTSRTITETAVPDDQQKESNETPCFGNSNQPLEGSDENPFDSARRAQVGMDFSSSSHSNHGSSDESLSDSAFWAQVALDFSWEQLHTGHWEDVKPFWRQAYALAALLKALNLYLKEKREEALVEIDKGILLGAPVINNSLHVVAAMLNKEILREEVERKGVATVEDNGDVSMDYDVRKIGKVRFRNYTPMSESSRTKKLCLARSINDLDRVPLIDMARRISVTYCPSLESFHQHHMIPSVAVVISGAMDHWPSYTEKKWK